MPTLPLKLAQRPTDVMVELLDGPMLWTYLRESVGAMPGDMNLLRELGFVEQEHTPDPRAERRWVLTDRGRAAMTETYSLGREYSTAEAIAIARRATFDPGAFCARRTLPGNELEELYHWQARAVVIALGPRGPEYEPKWSKLDRVVACIDPAEVERVTRGERLDVSPEGRKEYTT